MTTFGEIRTSSKSSEVHHGAPNPGEVPLCISRHFYVMIKSSSLCHCHSCHPRSLQATTKPFGLHRHGLQRGQLFVGSWDSNGLSEGGRRGPLRTGGNAGSLRVALVLKGKGSTSTFRQCGREAGVVRGFCVIGAVCCLYAA